MQKVWSRNGLVFGIVVMFLVIAGVPSLKADLGPQGKEGGSVTGPDEWPMFHHDLNHTGITTSDAPASPHLAWFGQTNYWIESSPVVANNRVFVTSEDGSIYCFDAIKGQELWTFQTSGQIINTPCVANGKVYFGSMDNTIYCLNEYTGALVWSYLTGWIIAQSAPAVYNGKMYIGAHDGNLYCFNADNGSVIWAFDTNQWISSPPAIYENRVYFGDWLGNIFGLNADNGSLEWHYDFGYTTYFAGPTIVDDRLYLGGMDFAMKCIDIPSCTLLWSVQTGYYVTSAPLVLSDRVIFCSWDRNISCVNKTTGMPIWKYRAGGGVDGSPAMASDGRIYVGSADGYVYCLDPMTGELYWSFDLGGESSSPAIAYGNIYACSQDNFRVNCLKRLSEPPVADFTWTPDEPETNQEVSFDATSSYDPDGSIALYEWDWDADGHYDESHATPYATHTWPNPGNYSIRLRVTDNSTDWGTMNKSITIHVPPVIPDTTPPSVAIITPIEGMCTVFFHGKQILQRPCPRTIVVGYFTVIVNASDNESGVQCVQFYLNGELQANLTSSPYSWAWLARGGFRTYNLTVKAMDTAGNWNEDSVMVLKIF